MRCVVKAHGNKRCVGFFKSSFGKWDSCAAHSFGCLFRTMKMVVEPGCLIDKLQIEIVRRFSIAANLALDPFLYRSGHCDIGAFELNESLY